MAAPGTGPIVVVGGGAAATFLLHSMSVDGEATRPVVVVDPAERIGPGVAYSTPDPVHLMNVCRIRLSVDGDGGQDLIGWLGERGVQADADTYLRRSMYGDYLADVADRCAASVGVDHRRARVAGLQRSERGGWRVSLDDGSHVEAGDVVLATGFPGRAVLPCEVPAADARILADPWARGAFDRPGLRRAVVVGTGLTMVDVALSLVERHPDVEVVAASRRGLVPRTSRPGLPATIDPDLLPQPGISGIDLRRHVIRLGRSHEDWQAVVDNVRPRANDIWRALTYGEQARILRRWFPWWNVHRHRTAPAVGRRLAALLDSGQLRIVRSRVAAVTAPEGAGRLRVRFAHGSVDDLDADLVVNAAGPSDDLSVSGDPIVTRLLADGDVVVGPHRLGLAVDRAGRAIGRAEGPTPGLWLVGALRRGTEWETTAIPEIRIQAGVVADRLLHGDSHATDIPVDVGRC